MSIGERLKLIRKESGLNQTEFGARINLSQTTIGLYESDNRVITDRALSQICSAFNINETWLKTGEGEMRRATSPLFLHDNSLDVTDREIIESYIRMTPAQRQFIKDWIRSIAGTMCTLTEIEEKTYGDMTAEEKKAALVREIDDETRGKTSEVSIGSNFAKNSSRVPKRA